MSVRVQGELFRLLEHEHLANAVVLVLANKQDLRVRSSLSLQFWYHPLVTGMLGRMFCQCLCHTLIYRVCDSGYALLITCSVKHRTP